MVFGGGRLLCTLAPPKILPNKKIVGSPLGGGLRVYVYNIGLPKRGSGHASATFPAEDYSVAFGGDACSCCSCLFTRTRVNVDYLSLNTIVYP